MEAPEKIYLNRSDRAGEVYEAEWAEQHWGEDWVEYTRTDALEVKEVDLEKEYEEFVVDDPILGYFIINDTMGMKMAKHFFELGLKVQKGE